MERGRRSRSVRTAVLISWKAQSAVLAPVLLSASVGCSADERHFFDEPASDATVGMGPDASSANATSGLSNSSAGQRASASSGGGTAATSAGVASSTNGAGASTQTPATSSNNTGNGGNGGNGGMIGGLTQTSGTTGSMFAAGTCEAPTDLGSTLEPITGSAEGLPSSFAGDCGGDGPEAVFVWTPPATARYEFSTASSEYQTALYLFPSEGCSATPICNAASNSSDGASLSQVLQQGEPVTLLVDAQSEAAAYQLSILERSFECSSRDLGQMLGNPLVDGAVPLDFTRDELRSGDTCEGGPPWLTFTWSAPADGDYVFSTRGSDYDTVLYLHPACGDDALACNDDTEDTLRSELELPLQAGQVVIIDIGVWDGQLGSNDAPQFSLSITEAD